MSELFFCRWCGSGRLYTRYMSWYNKYGVILYKLGYHVHMQLLLRHILTLVDIAQSVATPTNEVCVQCIFTYTLISNPNTFSNLTICSRQSQPLTHLQ